MEQFRRHRRDLCHFDWMQDVITMSTLVGCGMELSWPMRHFDGRNRKPIWNLCQSLADAVRANIEEYRLHDGPGLYLW